MIEKLKEKFNVSVNDELISLHIYAAQQKLQEYRDKFNLFFTELEFNRKVADQLSFTLMKFEGDKFKNDRLAMNDKLVKKMNSNLIVYSSDLFYQVMYVYVESQQWESIIELLNF